MFVLNTWLEKMAEVSNVTVDPVPAAPLRFVFPHIHDDPAGWGPCEVPE